MDTTTNKGYNKIMDAIHGDNYDIDESLYPNITRREYIDAQVARIQAMSIEELHQNMLTLRQEMHEEGTI